MGHLYWMEGPSRRPWSSGSAQVHINKRLPTGRMPLAIRCSFGNSDELELAMLETGAAWTVLGANLVQQLENELGDVLEVVRLSTRLGTFTGTLHRLPLTLFAEEGRDLTLDSTCLAIRDWPGPSVLGFGGCIDRIRLALEPGGMDEPARVHFGEG